jgi:hypothetical protein
MKPSDALGPQSTKPATAAKKVVQAGERRKIKARLEREAKRVARQKGRLVKKVETTVVDVDQPAEDSQPNRRDYLSRLLSR